MAFSTDLLLHALVLLNSKLKCSCKNNETYIVTLIQFDGESNKFKARYIRKTGSVNQHMTDITEGDMFFRVVGKNRITTFTQIDDNLSVE